MSQKNAMETLAEAAFYSPELARGLEGEFEIEEDGWGQGGFKAALEEVHSVQRTLVESGWRRSKKEERLAPYSHNIEVAVYRKQLKPGKPSQWIVVTVATRFGLVAKFKGMNRKPW